MKNIITQNKVSHKNWMDAIGFLLGWFSVIGQLVLMLQNRQADLFETIIRFFSFFTILTNILVALYFTSKIQIFKSIFFGQLSGAGTLTAITAFILVVGLVYQIILRNTWHPAGFQRIIDELLHSVIPLFVLIYWFLFADDDDLKFKNCKNWLWFPILYFVYVIIRGHFSNFYPYPFINVTEIGYSQLMINFILLTVFFLVLMWILIFVGHTIKKRFKN